ncbi:MAG: hypothetical protein EPN38_09380 [Rhodanobacteraceae bacterium]|nr:MAG: hypothetical protein EPN38_09380 [Rhodanobacteraceae bacterium]
MADIVDIAQARQDRTPHVSGQARCVACKHEWVGAHEFWNACHEKGPQESGAVQWLEGSNGELLIFTRAEYRQTLMNNIHSLPGKRVHFFQGETMPREDET